MELAEQLPAPLGEFGHPSVHTMEQARAEWVHMDTQWVCIWEEWAGEHEGERTQLWPSPETQEG